VFGKVPKRAIKVPTYTGGTTTPDFVYCMDGGKLTLLVETKSADLRGTEKRAVEAQKKLLGNIPGVHWKLLTSAEDVLDALRQL